MSRNVFISFLGTSPYEPVRYYLEEDGQRQTYKVEKFIQKTLLDYLSNKFSSEDKAYVFLTDQARNRNWENSLDSEQGLKNQIYDKYSFSVIDKSVADESSTAAIWDTFMALYDILEPGDTVYLDITHSWRYLPMLGSTLLSYAKALKSIEVGAIYYGAFERLGTIQEVKAKDKDLRWTPVLNLVSFSELQEWSSAAREFVRYGNPERWDNLTQYQIKPILKEAKGANKQANYLNDINKRIRELVPLINANRGKALQEFNFEGLNNALTHFNVAENPIKPLNPILELVKNKIAPFYEAKSLGWLEAVKWCIDHQLIQQGFTQLQEGLLTWLCLYFNHLNINPEFFDWKKKEPRNLLSSALVIINNKTPEDEWNGDIRHHKQIGIRILQFPIMASLASIYQDLSGTRNDINHGGYTNSMRASGFNQKLEDFYNIIREILEQEISVFDNQPTYFLNISNHPAANWGSDQLTAAREQFGEVEDMPFPAIPPDWEDSQIIDEANRYLVRILRKRPTAVHLMGEMTFTYALAQKLKHAGIPCVASTTIREVVDHGDGRKEAQFRFVRFRPYF